MWVVRCAGCGYPRTRARWERPETTHSVTGTPQGGVISPLLCNVYLNRLDRDWERRGAGVLCRYADDLVVMCKTRREAGRLSTS